ncbi:hypothetical protein SAY87_025057 [Trapa incisa]|uniref:Late embryogenesis abundant protein n=1 Tax=Trapa incisa TaxID=236973 RepID=A0AAN7GGU6_9MYRT|nr:hypothetical protein SAY87_025057 [Trapa incisa]
MAARVSSRKILLVSKRLYGTIAELGPAANSRVTKNIAESGIKREEEVDEKASWMRDPKTGYWMPEDQFDKVDVVGLREKFLSSNPRKPSSS